MRPLLLSVFSTANPVPIPSEQGSKSDSIPIVAGVVSAVGGAALIALAVLLKRRRASKQKITLPPKILPFHNDTDLEKRGEQPPDARPSSSVVNNGVGNGGDNKPHRPQHDAWPHRHTPPEAEGVGGAGIAPSPAPAAFVGPVRWSTGHDDDAIQDAGAGLGGEGTRQAPASEIGLGQAVYAAAQELARHCQVPGVSEVAVVVGIMANLVTDSRENDSASDSRLKQCRSIVFVLKRAAEVIGKVS